MNHLVQRLREKSRLGYWPLLGDEAADEIERLTQALKKANDQAEHFERERIAAWLDADWPADGAEERYHRTWIAAKLRLGA